MTGESIDQSVLRVVTHDEEDGAKRRSDGNKREGGMEAAVMDEEMRADADADRNAVQKQTRTLVVRGVRWRDRGAFLR